MRFATDVEGPVAHLVDRFVRLVAKGRGDAARGRNLYALRFLDSMGRVEHPLHVPYRPTRNPAAFLAMVFDLSGDALHGYAARLEGGTDHVLDAADEVRRHLAERLDAPWGRLADELEGAGFQHLADLTRETVTEGLRRPAVSDFPALLRSIESWMTPAQHAEFDVDEFVRVLPLHRVLTLLRYDGASDAPDRTRDQHPTGGDLRALVRRQLDRPWRLALDQEDLADPIAFLAAWPFDVAWLAAEAADEDFAVVYALATDANRPGRRWTAPPPYVHEEAREAFEWLAGRDAAAAEVRRETRLRRWGVSATFPSSTEALDERLVGAAARLTALHAGANWRAHVARDRDALEVARRRFVQRVADAIAEGVPA